MMPKYYFKHRDLEEAGRKAEEERKQKEEEERRQKEEELRRQQEEEDRIKVKMFRYTMY